MRGRPLIDSIEYEVPEWNQIYEMLLEQSEKINKNGYHPDIIIGIARGGMVPANIIADLLGVRQVSIIQIEFYEDIAKPNMQPVISQFLSVTVSGKKILMVDDISDSGQSLKMAKQYLIERGAAEVKIATLYAKATTQTMPDFVEKLTDCWIVFPWEIKETLQSILQKQKNKQKVINDEFIKLLNAGLSKQFFEQILKTLQGS
jgi:hypoxanthine phosphoribosyltransferase